MKLDRSKILQLAAEAVCDPRSVVKVYAGEVVRPMVLERVQRAAERLKLPAPPAREES